MKEEKKLTKSDLNKMFLRSNIFAGAWNFERTQSLGFVYIMIPLIKRLYSTPEEQKAALKRHLEWYNTQPWISSLVYGVVGSMEEERANGAEIDDQSINSMKIGLMGPLAGIGDPLFWGTARPVFAALGAALALSGNILGPILFFILINAVRLSTRYFGLHYGYTKGKEVIKDMSGNRLKKLTETASVIGLFVMGALVSKWTTINIPKVVTRYEDMNGNEVVQTVQNILDSILPGLLPLGATLLVAWFLRKNANPVFVILCIFVIGILGYASGFLG